MSDFGRERETRLLLQRAVNALEKSALVDQQLLEFARKADTEIGEEIIVQTGPPLCPHCGRLSPEITMHPGQGGGSMAEMVLLMTCDPCGKQFVGQPLGWETYRDYAEYQGRGH